MKKFDSRVWIFIILAALLIPGYYHLRKIVVGDVLPIYVYFIGVVFSFIVTIIISYVNMVLIGRYFDKILPWTIQPRKINLRLILEFFITSVTAGLIISVLAYGMELSFPDVDKGMNRKQLYFDNISVALVVNLIAMSIIEGNSIYVMLKESLFNTEKLKRENIESQFAVLKNQVNPHFLFNSLNVLSSLVAQAPAKAQEFIHEFSKVYRYIFDVGDETVIEVYRELEFADAFVSLHQKRHGERLKTSVNVSADKLNRFIPVLSLQILIENAIKHNEISEKHPLQIEFFDDGEFLVIRNNLKPRSDKQESLGIGFQNLKERYNYLSKEKPVFIREETTYTARLPLLTSE